MECSDGSGISSRVYKGRDDGVMGALTAQPMPPIRLRRSRFEPTGSNPASIHPASCDAKPQNLSSAVPHDQQSIEQAKRDRRHDEQIHRRDAIGMVMKKRLPALRRWSSSLHQILGHARLADIDAELKQLSVDPRRSPQRLGDAHLAEKLVYLCR